LEKSPPQPGQRQWNQWKHQRHANENDDEEIGMRVHPVCDQIRSEVVTAKLIVTA
jgi:hypothetical protein